MKIVLIASAVAAISPAAFGFATATTSPTQTVLGSGYEDFETGGWTDPGLADVFSVIEIEFVQTEVPALYGDFWTADGADLEVGPAAGAFLNIVGFRWVNDISAVNFQCYSDGGDPPFGGTIVDLFLDGAFVGNASWGGADANPYVTVEGVTFDEMKVYHYNFDGPFIDDMSWQNVPAPGALALFGLAGLARRRRR